MKSAIVIVTCVHACCYTGYILSASGENNIFSVDDKTTPSFVCPPWVNLEKYLCEKEAPPPVWSQLQALPSLTKDQREKLQVICDDHKREFSKLIEEIRTLRKTAEDRRAKQKSPTPPPKIAAEPESTEVPNQKSKQRAAEGAHLPRPDKPPDNSHKARSTAEPPDKAAWTTMLNLFTVAERNQFDALVDKVVVQNKSDVAKINQVLTASNWKDLNDMKAGKYLPDHLKSAGIGDVDCMMEMSREEVQKK